MDSPDSQKCESASSSSVAVQELQATALQLSPASHPPNMLTHAGNCIARHVHCQAKCPDKHWPLKHPAMHGTALAGGLRAAGPSGNHYCATRTPATCNLQAQLGQLAGAVVHARPHTGRCCSPGSLSMDVSEFHSELRSSLSCLYSVDWHKAGAAAQVHLTALSMGHLQGIVPGPRSLLSRLNNLHHHNAGAAAQAHLTALSIDMRDLFFPSWGIVAGAAAGQLPLPALPPRLLALVLPMDPLFFSWGCVAGACGRLVMSVVRRIAWRGGVLNPSCMCRQDCIDKP